MESTKNSGLRVGELAELAATTPRAVRHYHKLGLLAEPVRVPANPPPPIDPEVMQKLLGDRLSPVKLRCVRRVRELLDEWRGRDASHRSPAPL